MMAEMCIRDRNSPHHTDPRERSLAREACLEQLRLADYVNARCAVNVSGAAGPVWYLSLIHI